MDTKGRFAKLRAALRIDPAAWSGVEKAWRYSGIGLLVVLAGTLALPQVSLERSLGVLAGVALALLIAALVSLLLVLLRRGDPRIRRSFVLLAVPVLLVFPPGQIKPLALVAIIALLALFVGLTGGGLFLLRQRGWRWPSGIAFGVGALGCLMSAGTLWVHGWPVSGERPPLPSASVVSLEDPGLAGAYKVETLTYGSGTDRHRPEFAEQTTLITPTVDGSRLIEGWEGIAGWARSRYWGFDAKALPLNGRVWYPEGSGPFPVVLIVHGNHVMEDYSDTGYAYLGELLASRGFVVSSVDENFLNSSFANLLALFKGGLDEENDARAWLLLEHLRQFRQWTLTPGHRFEGKLDLNRVALIGHSRGGEAVAEAAAFNRVRHYPDDARVNFDYGFGIRGVIAIAPVDNQYDPRDLPTKLIDVSYLVIHGSEDGDVQSFAGSAQYARTNFVHCADCFKASVYVVGANHGQFNTSWGRSDAPLPWRFLLNLEPIMDPDHQRAISKSVFSAFLEATLHHDRDHEEWLASAPQQAPWVEQPVELVSDYLSARDTIIAHYEEDADLNSATHAMVQIRAQGLTRWREADVALKWDTRTSAAVLVGWERRANDQVPTYRFLLNQSPSDPQRLSFSLAMAEENPLRDDDATWELPDTLDFSIVLTDRLGRSQRVLLSKMGQLRKPVRANTQKLPWADPTPTEEAVFQRFFLDVSDLSEIDRSQLARLELQFDRDTAGAIYLDDVAWR